MKPVIAVFDIGKTNKKLFLFNELYQIVFEQSEQFAEITDEDNDVCEDIKKVTLWVMASLKSIILNSDYKVEAVNFSTYGASFVLLNEKLEIIAPLYNYLKPFPENLKSEFYEQYGGESKIAVETASPILGNLNSGMQLYLWKKQKSEMFSKIKYTLHLPQYLSSLFTKKYFSDMTSIGCHTALWDFKKNDYHDWVKAEKIDTLLAPIEPSNSAIEINFDEKKILVGVGLHDSSAALIPYLKSFSEPFILISTGTWCISMNPFNDNPLTANELAADCLCYLSYEGKPVKAARIFGGNEHDTETKKIANYFNCADNFYKELSINNYELRITNCESIVETQCLRLHSEFSSRKLSEFKNPEEAYYQLMVDIVRWQHQSTSLIIENSGIQQIFVDGGFSKNSIYMHLLARSFPEMKLYAATVAQSTALGAALAVSPFAGQSHGQLVETELVIPANLLQSKKINND